METKFFEIRDRATFMPVMAIQLRRFSDDDEAWLLRRAGYADEDIKAGTLVVLVTLSGGRGIANCDPYDWASGTLTSAHAHIAKHWADLRSGQVVDAEFIRGESAAPKQSERITEGGL